MLNEKNALVILWTGNKMPEELVATIGNTLIVNGITIPEHLTVVYKDAEGVAKALVREANGISTLHIDIADNHTTEAVRQAVVYIGKRFEASLTNTKGNLTEFALKLNNAVQIAHSNIGFNPISDNEQDRALIKAVEVISTVDAVIPATLARKYHITKQVCDVIKMVYNQFC